MAINLSIYIFESKLKLTHMKSRTFLFPVFIIAVLTLAIFSCKKDKNETTNTVPAKVYLLTEDSIVNQTYSSKNVRQFIYNSSKKLVKIEYTTPPQTAYSQFDTLIYNTDGTLHIVNTCLAAFPAYPYATKTYTWTSGKITSIVETGNNGSAYTRTRAYIYSTSGYPSSMTVTYTTGSGTGEPETFTNLVYANGNLTNARLEGFGPAVATTDLTAANPYLGMNVYTDNLDLMFNKNNLTLARLDTVPNTVFVTKTYTYSNGRVATIHTVDQYGTSDNWLTYSEF